MGWFLLHLLTCFVNIVLIFAITESNAANSVFWLCIVAPFISYSCGRMVAERK